LNYSLHKDGIKQVPFHEGKSIEYQKGYILNEKDEKIFHFTYSTEPHLGKFRVTLREEIGEQFKTYVFGLTYNNNQLQIESENQLAMDVVKPFQKTVDMKFYQILNLIMKDGIQARS
jgi:hypothetical protein